MTSARHARPPGRGSETRASLLSAGMSLFASRGFDGTSVRDITRVAGTNLGAVTYHFGSKRALYEAVLQHGLSPLVEGVAAAAASPVPALDRLDAVVDLFFEYLSETPEMPHLLLQEVAAGKPPPEPVMLILQKNLANIRGILSQGREDGSIRDGHPVLSAVSIVSQPVYLSVMAPMLKAAGGIDLQDPATRRAVAEHVKTFVRTGLASGQESHP